jgi:hypothetical protein
LQRNISENLVSARWGILRSSTEFVSVGIEPLSYDLKYVDAGKLMAHFKGDMNFLAEKMESKCSPLTFSTKQEHIIYNYYLNSHAQPAAKN